MMISHHLHHVMPTQVTPLKFNPMFGLSIEASKIPLPKSPKIAMTIPEWKLAMQKEYDALIANHTWSLIPRLPEDNIINTKWIFKVKSKNDGTLERFKADWWPMA